MVGSVAGAVQDVVGGQVPPLHIFNATFTNKSLRYFTIAILTLHTDPPRLQTGSADPALELLVPLLRGHPQEQRTLVQLMFMSLNRKWIPEVWVTHLSRLQEPGVELVEVVQAPVLCVEPSGDSPLRCRRCGGS